MLELDPITFTVAGKKYCMPAERAIAAEESDVPLCLVESDGSAEYVDVLAWTETFPPRPRTVAPAQGDVACALAAHRVTD